MPKFNPKTIRNSIECEMTKWRGRSRVTKTSNFITYGKIKAGLLAMEKKGSKQEINQLSSYIGRAMVSFIYIIEVNISLRVADRIDLEKFYIMLTGLRRRS